MRSAQGGAHERGGRHISGAERIVSQELVKETTNAMLERAFSHSRGQADFINIVVEKIARNRVEEVPLLSVYTVPGGDVRAGHQAAQGALVEAGVTKLAAQSGITALLSLADSMGGAMLLCAVTGRRLDETEARGVRVSRMDIADEQGFIAQLAAQGINNTHVREALVLASKVAAAPGVVAELCWSDDPEYTTGYVASAGGYIRIPHCKPLGSSLGGRVFFVQPATELEGIMDYLQHQPVLVNLRVVKEGEDREVLDSVY